MSGFEGYKRNITRLFVRLLFTTVSLSLMAMQCHYKSSSIELTPPNSFSKAPLIPSIGSKSTKLVLDIVEHLRQRKAGNFVSKSEWYRINLRRGEYDDLLSRLKKEKSLWEFMRNKVKYICTACSTVMMLYILTI